MERKYSVADFAELVGTTAKTIYQKIDNYENLPVNEQLTTVKEKVKGRDITFIVTSDEQIVTYKNLYRKDSVNNGDYYENVTNINGYSQVNESQNIVKNNNSNGSGYDVFDKLMTLNETFLNRIETVTNELMEYKSKQLLLEDKASREGVYLKEINELKTDNEKLNNRNKWLQTVLITLLTLIITVTVTLLIVNNYSQTQDIKKEHAPIEKIENHAQKR
mgnify:CR=1 FL=1